MGFRVPRCHRVQGVSDVEVKSNRCYQYYDDAEAAADTWVFRGGGVMKYTYGQHQGIASIRRSAGSATTTLWSTSPWTAGVYSSQP